MDGPLILLHFLDGFMLTSCGAMGLWCLAAETTKAYSVEARDLYIDLWDPVQLDLALTWQSRAVAQQSGHLSSYRRLARSILVPLTGHEAM